MQALHAAPQVPALLLEIEGQEGMDVAGKMQECYKMLETATVTAE
jgi:hypothetical protein